MNRFVAYTALAAAFFAGAASAQAPAIAIDGPDDDRTDFFGNDIGAVIGDIDEVEVLSTGSTVQGIDVIHENVMLRETTVAYRNTLEAQGFTVDTTSSSNGNLSPLVARGEGGDLRIVLHRTGGNLAAYLIRS